MQQRQQQQRTEQVCRRVGVRSGSPGVHTPAPNKCNPIDRSIDLWLLYRSDSVARLAIRDVLYRCVLSQ